MIVCPFSHLFLEVLSKRILANGAFFGVRKNEELLEPNLHITHSVLLFFIPRHVLLMSLRRGKDRLCEKTKLKKVHRECRRRCLTRRRSAQCSIVCVRGRESASGRSVRLLSQRRGFCIHRDRCTSWDRATKE